MAPSSIKNNAPAMPPAGHRAAPPPLVKLPEVPEGFSKQTVVKGDTMWDLAKAKNVDYAEFLSANPAIAARPNKWVYPGDEVAIPNEPKKGWGPKPASARTPPVAVKDAAATVATADAGKAAGATQTPPAAETAEAAPANETVVSKGGLQKSAELLDGETFKSLNKDNQAKILKALQPKDALIDDVTAQATALLKGEMKEVTDLFHHLSPENQDAVRKASEADPKKTPSQLKQLVQATGAKEIQKLAGDRGVAIGEDVLPYIKDQAIKLFKSEGFGGLSAEQQGECFKEFKKQHSIPDTFALAKKFVAENDTKAEEARHSTDAANKKKGAEWMAGDEYKALTPAQQHAAEVAVTAGASIEGAKKTAEWAADPAVVELQKQASAVLGGATPPELIDPPMATLVTSPIYQKAPENLRVSAQMLLREGKNTPEEVLGTIQGMMDQPAKQ